MCRVKLLYALQLLVSPNFVALREFKLPDATSGAMWRDEPALRLEFDYDTSEVFIQCAQLTESTLKKMPWSNSFHWGLRYFIFDLHKQREAQA